MKAAAVAKVVVSLVVCTMSKTLVDSKSEKVDERGTLSNTPFNHLV